MKPAEDLRRLLLAGLLASAAAPGAAQRPAPPSQSVANAPRPIPPVPLPADDPAFDAALPPLGSLAVPSPAPPPAPAPAAADPAAQAQLAQPLAPLATFDATPPAQTPAEAARSAAPDRLRYQVTVTGLGEVGLAQRFRALSALEQDKRKAANAAQVRARAQADVGLAERLLHSEGYYDGTASLSLPAAPPADAPLPVTIAATPGERYALGEVRLTGLAPEPYRIARDAFALRTGAPIVSADIESAEAQVALRLPEHGYPFVHIGQRDILLDPATHRGDYTLPVDAGARSSFGSLRTAGDPVFGLDHLAVFPRFDRGDLYDARRTDDLRQALVATGLFRTVSVEPVATDRVQPDGTRLVDLLVRQARGKPRTLSASAGYATGEGVKAVGEWTHRNLVPPEGALVIDVTAGTLQQALGATFRRSDAGLRDRTFQAGATILRQRFDAYKAETATLAASLSRQSTPIWQKTWTYSIGGELTATRETPFDPANDTRPKSTYYLAALPLQGSYDGSNDLLNPTRGWRLTGKLTPTAQKQAGDGFDKYLSMLAETSGYYPLSSSLVLATRARVGSIVGAGRDDIAPSRRLYSGGGGSVRGFGYQQLGPKDSSNNPIGGRSLTEFAFEARYRFGNYGVVPFLDAGRVGENSTPSLSGMRYGVGIGARYYTNFGPFRIDVATPIDRQKGESKIALYISIGQAF